MADTAKTVTAETFAKRHDLTKPLSANDLSQFSLDELTAINKIFVQRALEVAKKQAWFRADTDLFKEHALKAWFNIRKEIDGVTVFYWTPEWNKNPRHCFFVPGEWWQAEIDELAEMERTKQYNEETFEDRHKAQMVAVLCGG